MLRLRGASTIGILLFLGLLAFTGAAVFAQTGQGVLTGSITDTSGAIIANVQVKVRNQSNNFLYTAVTTQEGRVAKKSSGTRVELKQAAESVATANGPAVGT